MNLKGFFKETYEVLKKPEVGILPGNLAYFMVFSILPILTLILYIMSSISIFDIAETLENVVPKAMITTITSVLNSGTLDYANGLSMIIAFFLISNGAHSIMITSDTLYGIENQSFLKRRIKALFITIVLIMLFIFTIFVLGFGNAIMRLIIDIIDLKASYYYIALLIKLPLSLFITYFMIKIIYTMAPNKAIPSKYMSKGSLFTAMLWIIATELYSIYVVHFADYTKFYGGLSSIIVLTIWVYILAFVMVIGIGINVNYYNMVMKKTNKKQKKENNNI